MQLNLVAPGKNSQREVVSPASVSRWMSGGGRHALQSSSAPGRDDAPTFRFPSARPCSFAGEPITSLGTRCCRWKLKMCARRTGKDGGNGDDLSALLLCVHTAARRRVALALSATGKRHQRPSALCPAKPALGGRLGLVWLRCAGLGNHSSRPLHPSTLPLPLSVPSFSMHAIPTDLSPPLYTPARLEPN